MRLIIINDMYVAGGAEIQSLREKKYFSKKGHEVLYITLDPNLKYHESKEKNHINLAKNRKIVKNVMDRYLCDKKLYNEIASIITKFNPDFVHLNNIYFSAPAVYKAVKNVFCIQTIRDFSVVCVKSTCILPDCTLCRGIKFENCFRKCFPDNLKKLVIFIGRYIALINNEKLRRKYVNTFISPSSFLTDYCVKHGFKTKCINNPFDFNITQNFVKDFTYAEKKIYMYYGVVAERKGILKLVSAFKKFADGKKIELHIVGKLMDIKEESLCLADNIKYMGFMSYEQIIEKLKSVYVVVVPSIWIENYPNTVLEGFATDCIVIGSNRGGIPEQITDSNFIFDVMNENDILRCLNYTYFLNEEERQKTLDRQKTYLKTHNTQEVYYENILKLIPGGIK